MPENQVPNKLSYDQLVKRVKALEQENKQLRKTEERYKLAFEATDDGIWDYNPQNGSVIFSSRVFSMLGYEQGELPEEYESWAALLHPEDRDRTEAFLKQFAENPKENFSAEFRIRRKNGEWCWIHSRGKAIGKNADGNVCRMIGTLTDITERKKMEKRLRLIQFAFDNASIGIFRISDDGRFLGVNDYVCRTLGYSREEFLRMVLSDIDPAFTPEVFAKHRQEIKDIPVKTFESFHKRKDGTIFPVEITVNSHEFEGERFAFSFSTDISERKQAYEMIKEKEERLESIYKSSPAGIVLVFNRTILDVNDRFTQMTGYFKDELIGKNALMLYPSKEEYEQVGQKYRQIIEHGFSTVETQLKCKNGRIIDVLIGASPFDPADLSAGITYTALDITEQKQAEKERARIEALYVQSQKVEAVGQLAGGVAHDLNNLLSPVLGFSELLLARPSADEFQNNALKQIVKASLGARDLVRQLLAFSRKQTLEYKTLDLNKVLMDFEKLLLRTIRENIRLNIVTSPFIRPVMADIGQIEQVIMNLSINAADAMPEGGELTIETEAAELDGADTCELPDVKTGAYVMLAFSDTGHGMDEKICSKIFEPFFSTKKDKGTGLGLSTVFGIVKQHGGNIWVYSEPGNGTTFRIYLPVSAKTEAEDQREAPPPSGLDGSETILLVEDNSDVRIIAKEILELYGYTVISAVNGKEALELPAEDLKRVDLLLTDVIMPDVNGRELYLKLSAKLPELKVLFMSGYTNDVIARHGVLEKGVQYIQKPFAVEALAVKVREVLNSC